MNAGEEVGVVPGEPQPRPGVGLRAGGGAELGGDEVPEVLVGSAPADVLLHRLEHPPVHRRRGRHRSAWAMGRTGGVAARVLVSPTALRPGSLAPNGVALVGPISNEAHTFLFLPSIPLHPLSKRKKIIPLQHPDL